MPLLEYVDFKEILEMYEVRKMSICQISEKLGTYPNRIRRKLMKNGIVLRDKSSAQELALKKGRAKHPTKGKHLSDETKLKLSESSAEVWKNLSIEALAKRKEVFAEKWKNRSKSTIVDMQKKAASAISNAGRKGSKIEHFLVAELPKYGYNILFHKKNLILNADLEPDLVIVDLKTVIEIDGPSHFLPIWGEETLNKKISADNEKNGLFLANGYFILRVKHLCKTLTSKKKRDLVKNVVESLKKIETLSTPKIIEIEV